MCDLRIQEKDLIDQPSNIDIVLDCFPSHSGISHTSRRLNLLLCILNPISVNRKLLKKVGDFLAADTDELPYFII